MSRRQSSIISTI